MKFILSILLVGCFAISPLYAQTQGDLKACMQYQKPDHKWSHPYSVRGSKISGREFNYLAQGKGFKPKYQENSFYYVVNWKSGGYVGLKLNYDDLSYYDQILVDQNNRKWKIRKGWKNCDVTSQYKDNIRPRR